MEKLTDMIDALHLEDLRNELHPSIFDENESYDMLIIRLPVIATTLQGQSTGFVITAETSYLYDKAERKFIDLQARFEGPHRVVDRMADRLLKLFDSYQDRIADMEEALYDDETSATFMTDWLELKRDILRIERITLRTASTMLQVIDYYEQDETFPINYYVDLHEHIDRTTRSAALQLSKLDYLYNFYNARTNEKMNKMIYILTIISAIFLPLNLVVGFFGMNTSGLPFAEGSSGTVSAVALMASLVVVTSVIVTMWRRKVER